MREANKGRPTGELRGNEKKQATLPGIIRKTVMYEANSLRQQTLDNALLEMIASDMQPSSIVNDKGFKRLSL